MGLKVCSTLCNRAMAINLFNYLLLFVKNYIISKLYIVVSSRR